MITNKNGTAYKIALQITEKAKSENMLEAGGLFNSLTAEMKHWEKLAIRDTFWELMKEVA